MNIQMHIYIYNFTYCRMNYIVLYITISVSAKWQNADKRPCHLCFPANLPGWSCTVGTSFAFDNVISILRRSSLWFFFPETKFCFSVHHWFLRDRNPTLVVEKTWVQSGFLVPFSGENKTLKTSQTNLAMGNPFFLIIFSFFLGDTSSDGCSSQLFVT